jgi:hypothetical protein
MWVFLDSGWEGWSAAGAPNLLHAAEHQPGCVLTAS